MLARNITRQFLNQILILITGFIASVITARLLGVEGRGNYALILNTSNFLNLLLGFSLGSVIVHVISTDKTPFRNTINSLTLIISALIIFCLLLLLIFPFDSFKFLLPANENVVFWKFVLLFLFLCSLAITLFNSILSGKKLFSVQQRNALRMAVFSCLAFIILYVFKSELEIDFRFFILFQLAIIAITVASIYWVYFKNARPPFTFTFLSQSQLKYILSFSFMAYVANIFQFLSYKMDFWFVEYYNGTKELGIYSLSVNLAQMLWLMPQAISTVFIAYSGSNIEGKAVSQTNTLVRITISIILVVAAILAAGIDFFIPVLYGVEFSESAFLFKLLLLGIVPFCITTIIASYFAGKGVIKINLYCSLIGFAICLLFDIILIPKYGIRGAAIATIISYCISTVYIIFMYMQKTDSRIKDFLVIKKGDIQMLKNKFQLKNNNQLK